MIEVTEKILEEMVKVIVETVNPEKVILFGSRGRGTKKDNSDVDFLIVESGPLDRRKETAKIWRSLSRFEVPTDILIFSNEEMNYWSDSINHVIARALREGKVVYERH
jgi:predicted nucleotidyltransferase